MGGQLASPLTFGGSRLHISCDRPLVEAKKKKKVADSWETEAWEKRVFLNQFIEYHTART